VSATLTLPELRVAFEKKKSPIRETRVPPVPTVAPATLKAGVPQGATEVGWLPDCVYTGDKFEFGMAFFADAQGRITRFSREPADIAAARRLAGQAALPGLVNGHSLAWQRVLRGRAEQRARAGAEPLAPWNEVRDRATARLTVDDVFEASRMTFLEMMLAGITCVGEFHLWQNAADAGAPGAPNEFADAVLAAAHEVGIRIALLNGLVLRGGHGQPVGTGAPRFQSRSVDEFLRTTETLRTAVAARYPADEVWLGVAPASVAAVPLDAFKAVADYAHAQRQRLHTNLADRRQDAEACIAEYGRPAVVLLADRGIVDKRFAAVHGGQLVDDEIKLLGTARASVCVCRSSEQNFGAGVVPIEKLLAAGAGIALGTGSQTQVDLLRDARAIEYELRANRGERAVFAPDVAAALLRAATVTGARSLGATGGALEVGRPADFFTVNLYEPSIAGAEPDALLANIVFTLERRAIREVWIGARQRIANGRHPNQGFFVGKFVELQRRLWANG
jgi:formimidoylglutamate deiminase